MHLVRSEETMLTSRLMLFTIAGCMICSPCIHAQQVIPGLNQGRGEISLPWAVIPQGVLIQGTGPATHDETSGLSRAGNASAQSSDNPRQQVVSVTTLGAPDNAMR